MLLSLQDAITPTHPTQGDTLGYKLLGFQPVNLLFLHRSITDIHGCCPCYSVPFRCYNNICLLFLHQSFTDIHGRCPCYSVPFRCYNIICLLFLLRSITDIHGCCPCYSVPFRCYNIICLLFLHQSITDIHGVVRVVPCHSVAPNTACHAIRCIGSIRC